MKIATPLVLSLTLLFLSSKTFSQQNNYWCGNPERDAQIVKEHPEILQEQQKLEDFTAKYIDEHKNQKNGTTYVIPVVFHIIHNFGPENISDAQINDAIRVMNADYQKQNADTANTIALFKPIAANVGVEFRLARKDPKGNCTNGIDRIQSMLTYDADDNSKLNPWPNNKYLNIWVVNSISSNGTAAYTYLPSTAQAVPTLDGIISIYNYVGSIGTASQIVSHTLSHETGHFLNLEHPWGSTNQPGVACGDDFVPDTPITEGWTVCNLSGSVCTKGVIENVQNFMDYSYCTTMFTNGQASRMYAALNSNTASRKNLWSAANLIATGTDNTNYAVCSPVPLIAPQVPLVTCAGGSLSFKNISTNGPATNWLWSFPGGNPSKSTDSVPTVVYNTPGTYNVSLTISNNSGSNSSSLTNYVIVLSDTGEIGAPNYAENFENLNFPGTQWMSVSPDNNTWQNVGIAGYSGTHSLELNNTGNVDGMVSYFLTPTFDCRGLSNPLLYFRVSFAETSNTNTDALRVYASTDCGKTWQIRYSKSGKLLATVGNNTTDFVPTTLSQWRQDMATLTSYANNPDVRLKFEFTYHGGNNIFIDDINFNQATGITEVNRDISLSVFPNPAEGKHFAVSFNLPENHKIRISLVTVEGQEFELMNSNINAGHQLLNFNPSDAAAGIYFLKLEDEYHHVYTQRVVLQ